MLDDGLLINVENSDRTFLSFSRCPTPAGWLLGRALLSSAGLV